MKGSTHMVRFSSSDSLADMLFALTSHEFIQPRIRALGTAQMYHCRNRFNRQRRHDPQAVGEIVVKPLLRPLAPAADQDRINKMNRMPKPKDFIL